jgi:hypothetical protein
MARRVEVQLLDDVDGSTADETLPFGLDGTTYEIDLTGVSILVIPWLLTGQRKDGRAHWFSGSVDYAPWPGRAGPVGRGVAESVRGVFTLAGPVNLTIDPGIGLR